MLRGTRYYRTHQVKRSVPQEVLAGLLGYSDEEIAQLHEGNVIAEFEHYNEIPG